MTNNRIVKRTYYEIQVALVSPVNISNGVSVETDADVMRNSSEECFIPGTSLAGAFRNYTGKAKDEPSVFGYSKGEDGKMSSVFISDLYFDKETLKLSVRDRVSLDSGKTVDNKFDVEIIEPGASGTIRIETVHRENTPDPNKEIEEIILALDDGDIRFGSIKNRGFGRIEVISVRESSFGKNDKEKWIEYLESGESNNEAKDFGEWKETRSKTHKKYIHYSVPLSLTGGISIRRYSAQPGKADFEHITSNGKPVIPGTSWNGAIRADAKQILLDLDLDGGTANSLICDWFGKVKEKAESDEEENKSRQSKIVFFESEIEGAKSVPMTRNNINRFTAGTKSGALYSELSCVGGGTTLEYMIENPVDSDEELKMKALEGLMKLVVRDICLGLVAVGGQVAVGRGIFSGETEDLSAEDECLKALYQEIRRLKVC